jgi:hypothetical protein
MAQDQNLEKNSVAGSDQVTAVEPSVNVSAAQKAANNFAEYSFAFSGGLNFFGV